MNTGRFKGLIDHRVLRACNLRRRLAEKKKEFSGGLKRWTTKSHRESTMA
jgi:hypothetical protein